MKLKTLKPSVRTLASAQRIAPTPSENRIAGAANQRRRWKLWQANPYCAKCGRLMDWPYGCEADHVVPVTVGGVDDISNMQLLCVWWEVDGTKQGCHAEKTAEERSRGLYP